MAPPTEEKKASLQQQQTDMWEKGHVAPLPRYDDPTEQERAILRQRKKDLWGEWSPEPVQSDKKQFTTQLKRICYEQPFIPAAFGVLAGVLGWGYYSYKTRPAYVSPISHLTRLRLAAQGSFILVILGGVVMMDVNKFLVSEENKEEKK